MPNQIHIGTSGWAYTAWKPVFYPPKTPSAKFLDYYASQLNTVEVNFTFRARVTPTMLEKWSDATPTDFVFVFKAPQRITHMRRLKDADEDVAAFYASLLQMASMGKLGPVLFQLPPNLKADEGLLRSFLTTIPSGRRAAMEFRHPSWFSESTFGILREGGVALCVAESDGLQTPQEHTANFSYFRFRMSNYSPEELERVQRQIRAAATEREVFAFMKHEETPECALNARSLRESLR